MSTALPAYRAFAACLLIALVSAAAAEDGPGSDRLFASDDLLDLRIIAPFETIKKERPLDEEISGTLTFSGADGEIVELDVGIRTRGRYRRQVNICPFPPLRLNFKKKQVAETLFDGQDKLKLVTHCQPDSYVYEQAVLAEYLAYRILNLVTDVSYRARLLRVNYAESAADEGFQALAILIEHKDSVARRIGLPNLEIERTSAANVNREHLNLVSVFHFLIGNTDFSPVAGSAGDECCHNHTLFGGDSPPYYSVPYDFDMSGFVNAPHASPNPKLNIDSVQERLYRGRCANNDLLPASLDLFRARRDAIESLINDRPELSRRTRKDMLRYVDGFYRTVSRPKSVERYLIGRCK